MTMIETPGTTTVVFTIDTMPVSERLQQLAREFAAHGDNAETFAEGDRWHHEAAQLRLVAHLAQTAPGKWLSMGRQWIDAAYAQLRARNLA